LSRLEYIHSRNYIHGDIKPSECCGVGLGDFRSIPPLSSISVAAKEFWNTSTGVHIPFRQGRRLTGTPYAFASINDHFGNE
ncbi:hypothetical protein P692DRAFT_201658407, partial [Suillus brevipes Sb2]